MRCRIKVSFEFDTRPPTLVETVQEASQVGTCVRRAIEQAQKIANPRGWSSLVACVVERLDAENDETSPEVDASEAAIPQ